MLRYAGTIHQSICSFVCLSLLPVIPLHFFCLFWAKFIAGVFWIYSVCAVIRLCLFEIVNFCELNLYIHIYIYIYVHSMYMWLHVPGKKRIVPVTNYHHAWYSRLSPLLFPLFFPLLPTQQKWMECYPCFWAPICLSSP